jgi:hypothetical protein
VAGCCEYGNEPSVFVRGLGVLLADRLLASQEGPCSMVLVSEARCDEYSSCGLLSCATVMW